MLLKTGVQLELLSDISQILFLERGVRGGVSYVNERMASHHDVIECKEEEEEDSAAENTDEEVPPAKKARRTKRRRVYQRRRKIQLGLIDA